MRNRPITVTLEAGDSISPPAHQSLSQRRRPRLPSAGVQSGLGAILTTQEHPAPPTGQALASTHDSSTARRGSGSGASGSWPPCSLPSRTMSQRV